jgi:platelet-activating factor acetylhydrolase
LEPFPEPGPVWYTPELENQSDEPPELLVINSEGFTLWSEHFKRVEALVSNWGKGGKSPKKIKRYSTLLTLPTSRHINFSDFPLFLPRLLQRSRGDGRQLLSLIQEISHRFLEGNLYIDSEGAFGYIDELKCEGRLKKMEVILLPTKKNKDGKGLESWKGKKLEGRTGDVVFHSV